METIGFLSDEIAVKKKMIFLFMDLIHNLTLYKLVGNREMHGDNRISNIYIPFFVYPHLRLFIYEIDLYIYTYVNVFYIVI